MGLSQLVIGSRDLIEASLTVIFRGTVMFVTSPLEAKRQSVAFLALPEEGWRDQPSEILDWLTHCDNFGREMVSG